MFTFFFNLCFTFNVERESHNSNCMQTNTILSQLKTKGFCTLKIQRFDCHKISAELHDCTLTSWLVS